MGELTAAQLALYTVLIVVTMLMLDWMESKRTRVARARRDRREQLDACPARKAA